MTWKWKIYFPLGLLTEHDDKMQIIHLWHPIVLCFVEIGFLVCIGCALAGVTIVWHSEPEQPFYPVGQFNRIWIGHSWCHVCSLPEWTWTWVLVAVVTVQMELSGSELRHHTDYLICSLPYCADSEKFSVRSYSTGCAIAHWIRTFILSCGVRTVH